LATDYFAPSSLRDCASQFISDISEVGAAASAVSIDEVTVEAALFIEKD